MARTYQAGFGNHFETEAEPGALPRHQASPREVLGGLLAEQINGTLFTAPRTVNRRSWVYRLRTAIPTERWVSRPAPGFGDLTGTLPTPQILRFGPLEPAADADFLDGLTTFAGAGDPALCRGAAIHVYAASRSMGRRAICNIDGDTLIVPARGVLQIQTELGWLDVAPREIAVIPRGIRFRVEVDGPASGFVAEGWDDAWRLPDRGVVGANGLADERHFLAPTAAYEDVEEPFEIVVKQGNELHTVTMSSSPFDVVAWFGNYTPYKYDLMRFNSYGSVSFDHPDPSILTVLTSGALDLAVFRGRWDPTEHTFRPPYLHRNSAVEFNGVVASAQESGPWRAGAFSYTPMLSPHGVSAESYGRSTQASDAPRRLPDESVWIQLESRYALKVAPPMLVHPSRDETYLKSFVGYPTGSSAKNDA